MNIYADVQMQMYRKLHLHIRVRRHLSCACMIHPHPNSMIQIIFSSQMRHKRHREVNFSQDNTACKHWNQDSMLGSLDISFFNLLG